MTNEKLLRLLSGETFVTSEKVKSMEPLINYDQEYKLAPIKWTEVESGDIVYCEVNGIFYTHLVKVIDPVMGCKIANNKGRTTGWTKSVFGKVIQVL